MQSPFDTTPVRLEDGSIARLRPKEDGNLVSEVFKDGLWVKGSSIGDVFFNGTLLRPDEITALKLLP